MKIIQHRKEWRHKVIMTLVGIGKNADDAIQEAGKIEKYVFQNDFIVEISDPKQKDALKNFIESINSN